MLQIVLDLERQGHSITPSDVTCRGFADIVNSYIPDHSHLDASLKTHSSTNGANYGSTSAYTQFETYKHAVQARRDLRFLHEIEWVQLDRSYAMTCFATEHQDIRLGSSAQLNITLLFGFSPKLPFPHTYREFREAVELAKLLEYDVAGERVRDATISVGAAVIPQQAESNYIPLDIGPRAGRPACALRRLATYAAQHDSGVDVLRSGMEDTPYMVDESGNIHVCDNVKLVRLYRQVTEVAGARVVTDIDACRSRLRIDLLERQVVTDQRERSQLLES